MDELGEVVAGFSAQRCQQILIALLGVGIRCPDWMGGSQKAPPVQALQHFSALRQFPNAVQPDRVQSFEDVAVRAVLRRSAVFLDEAARFPQSPR